MRADWDTSPEPDRLRICDKCGKKFMPAVFHQYVDYSRSEMGHISKGRNGGRKRYYCSYTCYNHRQKYIGSRGGKKVQAFDLDGNFVREFRDAQEAAMWLSEMGYASENRQIQRCCRGEAKQYRNYIFKYKEIEL